MCLLVWGEGERDAAAVPAVPALHAGGAPKQAAEGAVMSGRLPR